mgnify:CR=1 FL=1
MIAWGQIILLVLQLLDRMLAYGQQQKWINQGRDAEIAKAAVEVLRKTEYAKRAVEEFSDDKPSAVDDFLRDLGK